MAEQFADALNDSNFPKCEEVISQWEYTGELTQDEFQALRASVLLCKGEIEEGSLILRDALSTVSHSSLLDAIKKILIRSKGPCLEPAKSLNFTMDGLIKLCKSHDKGDKVKQPRGVKLRYWFGVGQIVAGCIIAPFSGGLGGGLIATGVATVVDAGADAMDNKDAFEENLRNRQKMDPNFQKSSYLPHFSRKEERMAC